MQTRAMRTAFFALTSCLYCLGHQFVWITSIHGEPSQVDHLLDEKKWST